MEGMQGAKSYGSGGLHLAIVWNKTSWNERSEAASRPPPNACAKGPRATTTGGHTTAGGKTETRSGAQRACASAPWRSSSATHSIASAASLSAAQCSGVLPRSRLRALALAPAARSTRAAAVAPNIAATCRADWPMALQLSEERGRQRKDYNQQGAGEVQRTTSAGVQGGAGRCEECKEGEDRDGACKSTRAGEDRR